ncbi:MAG: hypothetical protein HY782_13150 [Chloroflexi bacterium]|nr:hypothetical protein [Chloroflexota bacterium]
MASWPTLRHWRSLIVRVVVATGVAWMLATAPLPLVPSHVWVAYVQVPLVVFVLICYIGKLLIDTFYYDHYKP